jgi:hypothetical protein
LAALLVAGGVALLVVQAVLPGLGTLLVVESPIEPADAALVLEGTGRDAMDAAESWRQAGLVRSVVVVEAPIKTHALVTYWSDLVARGLAEPPPTPPASLQVVRAPSTQSAEQGRAALPALEAIGARSVLVPGGGSIGSRVVERDLGAALGPSGIRVRLVRVSDTHLREPSRWYASAEDRRAVLDTWLQLLVPYLAGA